ncbi:MAG: cysteine desulfurase [Eggerthellaceae bacterium]|nr:cysteine desulfurase [Eggerthellaceae bacterium]
MAIRVPDNYVYLDWAATAPLGEEAVAAMAPYLEPGAANIALGMNANSLHAPGRAAFEAMEIARRQIAADLGASRPNEIVFTSGATEADNMAVAGIARACAALRRRKLGSGFVPRVITTALEHEAVAACARKLAKEGFDVVFLKPDHQGFVKPEVLEAQLTESTVLVSVQMANSEVGSVQPVAELAKLAHGAGALFHTDAVQALAKVPIDLRALDVDAASFAAHKIGGPKGVGALYLKARTPVEPLLVGGGQEGGLRSSTQNVCGVAGFAAACHAAVGSQAVESARQMGLRDLLYAELAEIDRVTCTVDVPAGSTAFLPNIVHVLVDGYESETLVLRLDRKGFGVSGGSACSSHSLEASHVLRAMGISGDAAFGALRVSIGRLTTEKDIRDFVVAFKEVIGV